MTDISLVTAVYNRAGTIGRAMESIAAQTVQPFEHIVIDGASKDDTLGIVRSHATPSTKITSEPDKGIYDALNKGIRAAGGDVIGLLHSDDLFADDTVLDQVRSAFDEDTALDAVYADASFFHPDAPEKVIRRYSSARFSPVHIAWGLMPAHPTLYLRRSVFDRFGDYRTDYRIAADYEFIARIFSNNAIKSRYIPHIWVHMQTGGASTGGLSSTFVLNKEVMRACRENSVDTNWFKLLSKYPLKVGEFLRR